MTAQNHGYNRGTYETSPETWGIYLTPKYVSLLATLFQRHFSCGMFRQALQGCTGRNLIPSSHHNLALPFISQPQKIKASQLFIPLHFNFGQITPPVSKIALLHKLNHRSVV